MSKLLEGLNKEQLAAVKHDKGPLLIVAGAGTGKTTVLTRKIAYLISEKKIEPSEILALTFTDKAVKEMEERVEGLLDFGYYDFWISTFHAFCDRVLKNYGLEIGLPSYSLIDQTKAWILIKRNFDKFLFLKEYRPLGNPTKFIHALISHFSQCKNEGIYPEHYLEHADSLKKDLTINTDLDFLKVNEIADAYHTYQQLLLDNNYLDFGDLINYTLKLFEKRPKVLQIFHRANKTIRKY